MPEPIPREDVYRAYWTFASERQRIFEKRLDGEVGPWTTDPILRDHRFCNVFRAADRVSQHLIQHAAYGEDDLSEADVFLRVVLHRLFCRPATWDLLRSELGRVDAESFSPQVYDEILGSALARGDRLYTGAFILCANRAYGHARKHQNHLALLEAMLEDGAPNRVAKARSLEGVYNELRGWPLIGPFMAYQLAIDLNYSPLIDFSEDDFTVPGPGALRGLKKVFVDLNGLSPADAVHWLVEQQGPASTELGIAAPRLFGRELHAIDCQNLLCEVDKYARVAFPALESNRTRIKQRFTPDETPLSYFFPPDWGINELIPNARRLDVDDPACV